MKPVHLLLLLAVILLCACGLFNNSASVSQNNNEDEEEPTDLPRPTEMGELPSLENDPTIPVFYPWPECEDDNDEFWFDCDTPETPYALVWISAGINEDIAAVDNEVWPELSAFLRADTDILYLINEEWHYWNLDWRTLSPDSEFYLDEYFGEHIDSEYGDTKMINFTHPDWPAVLAQKAVNFQQAGYDGMMFDWWHNEAGNGRSPQVVEDARMAIAEAIRTAVGPDFILMGNVNWEVDDPTAQYFSAAFLELWKEDPASGYVLTYDEEDEGDEWTPSIERMEDVIHWWSENLQAPAIVAVEPWKITTGDFIEDRYTEENQQFARLFAAMTLVIADNGYFLYADNNDDWDEGDHQHAYYDFYHTDLGRPVSAMIEVQEGAAYKLYEKGLIAYNRTEETVRFTLSDGSEVTLPPLEGVFLEME